MKRNFLLLFILVSTWTQSFSQQYIRIDSLNEILQTTRNKDSKIKALIQLSREYEYIHADTALRYAHDAYELAEKSSDRKEQVRAMVQEGRLQLQVNNYIKALEILEAAIILAEKHDMPNESAIGNGVIAIIHAELGNFDLSAKYNFIALRLFEQVGNQKEVGVTLGNIAADLLSQKNYPKALKYMNDAREIAVKIHDKPGIAQQYNNIAGVYYDGYQDYTQAKQYYYQSFLVNTSIKDRLQAGINLLNIGYCHFRLRNMDSALYFYNQSREMFQQLKSAIRTANCDIALAQFFHETGDPDKALKFGEEALVIGRNYDSKELTADASSILHSIYLQKGDTIQAYRYSRINDLVKDSLLEMQSQKTLFKLEFQYNYEKKDKERRLKQQRSNFIMGFLILGLASGLIIIFLVYSRQKIRIRNSLLEKQKIASELNFKNKELTINLMALKKKNDLLSDISQKLIYIEKDVPKDQVIVAVSQLNKELKLTADEKIWKEFSLRFNQTNSEFYDKLLLKFPELTQNELRLCAYLRLNMTTKEIAEITGQRILTLESARYRLRKKLGITGSDNNLVTFLSQI